MKIIQAGRAKSGNFWLFKILQSILTKSGYEWKSYIQTQPIHEIARNWDLSYKEQADIDVMDIEPHGYYYRISSIFRMPIEDVDDYLSRCRLVWTHSPFCKRSLEVLPKLDKIVYIVRDPRDAAVSRSRFAFTPYFKKYHAHGEKDPEAFLARKFERGLRRWVEHVGEYLKHKKTLNIYFVFYERLLHSFESEILDLLAYLGIELDETSIKDLRNDVDFTTMKNKNPIHVRRGRGGEWVEVLTPEQKRLADKVAGPMLKLLNYPSRENEMGRGLPYLSHEVNNKGIEKAVRSAKEPRLVPELKRFIGILYTHVYSQTR